MMYVENTVGSLSNLLVNPNSSYILGLWGADKYERTSSIGLSNTDLNLIRRFAEYLLSRFPKDRLRLRIYNGEVPKMFECLRSSCCRSSKNKLPAYHIYVNSRPLLREFRTALACRNLLVKTALDAYLAGRFDGDGSISAYRKYCRIVYGNCDYLVKDRLLLSDLKTSVYKYHKAGTYCLYFSEVTLDRFLERIKPYSLSN